MSDIQDAKDVIQLVEQFNNGLENFSEQNGKAITRIGDGFKVLSSQVSFIPGISLQFDNMTSSIERSGQSLDKNNSITLSYKKEWNTMCQGVISDWEAAMSAVKSNSDLGDYMIAGFVTKSINNLAGLTKSLGKLKDAGSFTEITSGLSQLTSQAGLLVSAFDPLSGIIISGIGGLFDLAGQIANLFNNSDENLIQLQKQLELQHELFQIEKERKKLIEDYIEINKSAQETMNQAFAESVNLGLLNEIQSKIPSIDTSKLNDDQLAKLQKLQQLNKSDYVENEVQSLVNDVENYRKMLAEGKNVMYQFTENGESAQDVQTLLDETLYKLDKINEARKAAGQIDDEILSNAQLRIELGDDELNTYNATLDKLKAIKESNAFDLMTERDKLELEKNIQDTIKGQFEVKNKMKEDLLTISGNQGTSESIKSEMDSTKEQMLLPGQNFQDKLDLIAKWMTLQRSYNKKVLEENNQLEESTLEWTVKSQELEKGRTLTQEEKYNISLKYWQNEKQNWQDYLKLIEKDGASTQNILQVKIQIANLDEKIKGSADNTEALKNELDLLDKKLANEIAFKELNDGYQLDDQVKKQLSLSYWKEQEEAISQIIDNLKTQDNSEKDILDWEAKLYEIRKKESDITGTYEDSINKQLNDSQQQMNIELKRAELDKGRKLTTDEQNEISKSYWDNQIEMASNYYNKLVQENAPYEKIEEWQNKLLDLQLEKNRALNEELDMNGQMDEQLRNLLIQKQKLVLAESQGNVVSGDSLSLIDSAIAQRMHELKIPGYATGGVNFSPIAMAHSNEAIFSSDSTNVLMDIFGLSKLNQITQNPGELSKSFHDLGNLNLNQAFNISINNSENGYQAAQAIEQKLKTIDWTGIIQKSLRQTGRKIGDIG